MFKANFLVFIILALSAGITIYILNIDPSVNLLCHYTTTISNETYTTNLSFETKNLKATISKEIKTKDGSPVADFVTYGQIQKIATPMTFYIELNQSNNNIYSKTLAANFMQHKKNPGDKISVDVLDINLKQKKALVQFRPNLNTYFCDIN